MEDILQRRETNEMRIGLLVTSIGDFGKEGFYNTQESGLAKALDSFFDEVIVYKLVSIDQAKRMELLVGCLHTTIQFIPAKSIGSNGKVDTKKLDKTLDALIYFSDTQFDVLKVYKWAKKNNICFSPYIGVVKSHNTHKLKKLVVDFAFYRNLFVYRKSICLVKTPTLRADLKQLGVKRTILAPVGLDMSLLKTDYKDYGIDNLKKKYGYHENDKILLFIGRLVDEKQPLRMIRIFAELIKKDRNYKLLIIGTGPLKGKIEELKKTFGLIDKIQIIDCVPNCDIWELYRIADVFVNLNQAEIFGMAILEAMYYECKVVAWKAPGPNLIIENGISGWIVDNDVSMIEKIMDHKELGTEASKRISLNFTWKNTAYRIKELLEKDEFIIG